MSDEVRAWARRQQVPKSRGGAASPSTAKAVLNSMANCSNEFGLSFPSNAYLVEETCLDRKSIIDGQKRLEELGLLIDTGERRGRTGQVRVWRLNLKIELVGEASRIRDASKIVHLQSTDEDGISDARKSKRPEYGTLVHNSSESVDIEGKAPVTGTLEESRKRDASDQSYPQSVPFSAPLPETSLTTDLKIGIQNKSSGSPPVDKAQAGPEPEEARWQRLRVEAEACGFRAPVRPVETLSAYSTALRNHKLFDKPRSKPSTRRLADSLRSDAAAEATP